MILNHCYLLIENRYKCNQYIYTYIDTKFSKFWDTNKNTIQIIECKQ